MDVSVMTRKQIGEYGEKVAKTYFLKQGFTYIGQNVSFKTGEIDLIVYKNPVMHFIEVKTSVCSDFLASAATYQYGPAQNLHALKIRKVRRTSEWYVAKEGWEGDTQIDAVLVWLRRSDGVARIRYIPQIL